MWFLKTESELEFFGRKAIRTLKFGRIAIFRVVYQKIKMFKKKIKFGFIFFKPLVSDKTPEISPFAQIIKVRIRFLKNNMFLMNHPEYRYFSESQCFFWRIFSKKRELSPKKEKPVSEKIFPLMKKIIFSMISRAT